MTRRAIIELQEGRPDMGNLIFTEQGGDVVLKADKEALRYLETGYYSSFRFAHLVRPSQTCSRSAG